MRFGTTLAIGLMAVLLALAQSACGPTTKVSERKVGIVRVMVSETNVYSLFVKAEDGAVQREDYWGVCYTNLPQNPTARILIDPRIKSMWAVIARFHNPDNTDYRNPDNTHSGDCLMVGELHIRNAADIEVWSQAKHQDNGILD